MLSIWMLLLLLKCMPLFSTPRCRLADFIFQLCSLVSERRTMSFNKPRETEPHNFDLQVHLDITPLLCSSCLFLVLWITKLYVTMENFAEQRIPVNFNILFLHSPCPRICPLTNEERKDIGKVTGFPSSPRQLEAFDLMVVTKMSLFADGND